ncbi:MAG: prolipoprotein diacylglyceryl transferase [Acidimicrobiia bacterium]|nr:prolipoprotein diacylglyceryl transferase [Acidimicrobiia bacterium]
MNALFEPVGSAVTPLFASIPSPGSGALEIGPFSLRMYGVMIALGVLAAIELARRRWRERGGDPDDITSIAIWAVPAGLVGARLYHVITDWNRLYADDPLAALEIWNGGLGIPGGVAVGVLVGVLVGRSRNMRIPVGLDVVAPALPLAQAIGRFGNWFNQELYGRPTDLPWALEIDPAHRVAGYETVGTFHPTFLYESLWNLALVAFLLWLDSKRVLRPGRLFVLYVGGYALGRFWVEGLRIDTANEILGLRVNEVVSLAVLIGVVAFLAVAGLRRRPTDDDAPYTTDLRVGRDGDSGSRADNPGHAED